MPVFNYHFPEFIPEGAVNIMRPSIWSNMFVIGRDGDRATVIAKYREWLWSEIRAGRIPPVDLAALDDAAVVCCCAPKPCHGDVLLAAAKWAAKNLTGQ